MDRKSAAKTLRQIGRLLELQGENPYRVRAFTGASRAVESLDEDIGELVSSGRILEVKGIGKGTAAVLQDLADGRKPQVLEEIESAVPEGVREMLTLSGLGPKKVRTIWRDLGAETLGELEYACRENRLVELKGFGPASQEAILDALVFRGRTRDRFLVHQAWQAADRLIERLVESRSVGSAVVAGELRRSVETVDEITLVVVVDIESDAETIARSIGPAESAGDGVWSIRPDGDVPVRIWFTPPSDRGPTLIRATGSEGFVAALEAGGERLAGEDEFQVLGNLGLPWIPPELREDVLDLAGLVADGVPRLVEETDLRGVLHNHTTDSDGAAGLEEMAAAAADRGWSFFGVADHSPAAFYANGVDADRLRRQWERADAWNASHPELRIVKGLEADILPDGRLDIPEGCEDGLEMVVASVHSSFKLGEEAQTERIVRAVEHPTCRVLGHPTGRLLLARPGYAVDLERVLQACRDRGVAVEINASPYRLDLDAEFARRALELGLKLAVNPDAHSVEGLGDVRWGIGVARRAGATSSDLVNCMDINDFLSG